MAGALYGHFGYAVAASGPVVVVGAPDGTTYSGAADIYQA